MKEIRTQSEFNNLVANMQQYNIEKIIIYPLIDGNSYKLSSSWVIPDYTIIEGVSFPKIEYIGDVASGVEAGIIQANGNTTIRNKLITIKGLELIGKTVTGKLHGFYANYCGSSPSTSLTTGDYARYDSTTVGRKTNDIGITIENCNVRNVASGVKFIDCHNSKVLKNHFSTSEYGIYCNLLNKSIISGNYFNGQSVGCYFESCVNNIVSKNTLLNCQSGMDFLFGSSNIVNDNSIDTSIKSAITCNQSNFNTLTNNILVECDIGIHIDRSKAIVYGNLSDTNINANYQFSNASDSILSGNNTNDAPSKGVNITATTNLVISSNTSYNNSGLDFDITSASTGIIYSNIYDTMQISSNSSFVTNYNIQRVATSYPSIYYVLPNSTAADINNAINLMTNGGLILFGKGEWTLNQPINITKSNITIQGVKGSTKLIGNFATPSVFPYGILNAYGSLDGSVSIENIIIEGLEITSSALGSPDGINLQYVGRTMAATTQQTQEYSTAIIRDCYIHDIGADGLYVNNIVVGIRIENNIIEKCERGVLLKQWSYNNYIINNTFKECTVVGISLDTNTELNEIIGNTFEKNYIGIGIANSSNRINISSNSFTNNTYMAISSTTYANLLTISNNIISGSARDGICIMTSSNNKIVNNSILNNLRDGIVLVSSHDTIISGNSVQSSTANGIYSENSNNLIVTSNISLSNATNLKLVGGTNIVNNHNITA